MASNPDISNSAAIAIGSDDETDQIPAVHEPQRMSLQDAISTASQAILAKTLLEICEHSAASRELASAILLPPLAPPALQGTKRRASPAEGIDRCGRQFSNTMQILRDCRYHPGELFNGRLTLSQ